LEAAQLDIGFSSVSNTPHSEVRWVNVEDLKSGPSPRQGSIDPAHVASLGEVSERWPPLLVCRDGEVLDGHHRLAAARRIGQRTVAVQFFDGSTKDGFVEAVRLNVEHGLPLTLDERRTAAHRILSDHPEYSDRRIAEVCGLSPRTVGRLRGTWDPTGDMAHQQHRVGLDGRVRPARPEENWLRILEAVKTEPEASLRSIAERVGTTAETVRKAKRSLQQDGAYRGRKPRPGSSRPEEHSNAASLDPAGRGGALTPLAPSATDSALISTPDGQRFADWFDSTEPESQSGGLSIVVPLNRVYEIADEARRRARFWSEFAEAVERRARSGS
jgi:ParB-like chromosome segregation protein Spo0J